MTPKDLKAHKLADKRLEKMPEFKPHKRNKLPKPLDKLSTARIYSTGLMDVSDTHAIFMYWRDGAIFTDRSFFAYLFCKLQDNRLSPLFALHWHPSHKGVHCKIPCKTTLDYTDRLLPQAPEFALSTKQTLDPKNEDDLRQLIMQFCEACCITLPDADPNTLPLFHSPK